MKNSNFPTFQHEGPLDGMTPLHSDLELTLPLPIYSIGYGGRSFEEFADLLKAYQIQYVVDIRSSPYSRSNPDYSQRMLKFLLSTHDIIYTFFGDTLGGRPSDESMYSFGRADYEKMSRSSKFYDGLDRLRTASFKKLRVAIMCSELKPENCHRSKLVGKYLAEYNIPVMHIDETGSLVSQESVMRRLTAGQMTLSGIPHAVNLSRSVIKKRQDALE